MYALLCACAFQEIGSFKLVVCKPSVSAVGIEPNSCIKIKVLITNVVFIGAFISARAEIFKRISHKNPPQGSQTEYSPMQKPSSELQASTSTIFYVGNLNDESQICALKRDVVQASLHFQPHTSMGALHEFKRLVQIGQATRTQELACWLDLLATAYFFASCFAQCVVLQFLYTFNHLTSNLTPCVLVQNRPKGSIRCFVWSNPCRGASIVRCCVQR